MCPSRPRSAVGNGVSGIDRPQWGFAGPSESQMGGAYVVGICLYGCRAPSERIRGLPVGGGPEIPKNPTIHNVSRDRQREISRFNVRERGVCLRIFHGVGRWD